jgi:hypothetical protein
MNIHTLNEPLYLNTLNISEKINNKLCNKINKINILKDNFNSLINKQFEDNIINDDIKKHLDDQRELYQFSKLMKIYEYNEWNKLKFNYLNFRKKITLYNKSYLKIIKLYADIINYFNQDEICTINDKIIFLENENQITNYNYALLCRNHRDNINKRLYLVNNIQFIKIHSSYSFNNSIEHVIKKLYNVYYKITKLNKQYNTLKIAKNNISNIINEIMKIKIEKLLVNK